MKSAKLTYILETEQIKHYLQFSTFEGQDEFVIGDKSCLGTVQSYPNTFLGSWQKEIESKRLEYNLNNWDLFGFVYTFSPWLVISRC